MKFINLYNIKNNTNFFLLNIFGNKKRWGRIDNTFLTLFFYKGLAIIDPLKIFVNIKKIIWIISKISYNQGISLIYFNKELESFYLKEFEKTINNMYLLMIGKLFGFVTSFFFFIDRIKNLKKQKITNYSRRRHPSLIFLTKKCWKIYYGLFRMFVEFRIISIKSISYNDVERNPGFSLYINDCSLIYLLIKYIYIINNKFIIKS